MSTSHHVFHNHLFCFEEGALALHKNLMTCVIVGKQHPVILSNDEGWAEAEIICIKPGIPHRVLVKAGGADIIYLDGVCLPPDRNAFQPLQSDWRALPLAFENADPILLDSFRENLQSNLSPPDQSIMQIVHRLYDDPFTRLSQIELAQHLTLERTQALRHFKATTGQTFRKFKIWAAIVAATRIAVSGTQIGHAGVEAGFSDAAHLARTAATVFGITPTKGLSGLKGMQTLAASHL
jgi:AraC-like DNA-binding protein